ncbi:MAG: RIP metalloprotease RseP [Candidatus Mycalebacterium zealandia]|nr:MAG: RIP metalloprotease RseP [Candidatus Mycalebacterium zealandia]
MSSLTAFLLLIGLLVFVHEMGHFLVAKWCGVRVEQFSLGFGPTILSFTRGETTYKICLLPLGGYVKMTGESDEGGAFVENISGGAKTPFEKGDTILSIDGADIAPDSSWKEIVNSLRGKDAPGETVVRRNNSEMLIKASGEDFERIEAYSGDEFPRSFSRKSVSRRMAIVTAGPLMNFLLPFILIPVAFLAGVYVPAYLESEPVVVRIADGADKAVRKGDKIVSVNGGTVKKWRDVSSALSGKDGVARIEIERGGKVLPLEVSTRGIDPELIAEEREAVVGGVADGSPARSAGIKAGDKIVSINGRKISGWNQMASVIRESAGREIDLALKRNGKTVKTSVVPITMPGSKNAAIGITLKREQILKKFGLIESATGGIRRAAEMTVQVISLFFALLFSIIGGEMSLGQVGKTVAGPLFIAKMSGAMAEQGIASLLMFASFISVNLAVVNLLPIPVLDGGHMVYLTIEAARKKPLSRATLETAQRIGFSFLIVIMLVATYNDVTNLWGGIAEWLKSLTGMLGGN